MNKVSFLNNSANIIPASVRVFLIRAFIIFVCWKLLYYLILLPARIPDRQLTILTAQTTSLLFNILHSSRSAFKEQQNTQGHTTVFFIDGQRAIGIADRCNALELIILYIGFLLSVPLGWKKQLTYLVTGTLGIFILNVLRCYALALLNLHNSPVADFAQHYLFTTFIYGLIFLTWIKYSKPYFKNDE